MSGPPHRQPESSMSTLGASKSPSVDQCPQTTSAGAVRRPGCANHGANPGGAYSVNEGASKQLNASASSDAVGIASIEWDLDYDGTTFNADATGATPTI